MGEHCVHCVAQVSGTRNPTPSCQGVPDLPGLRLSAIRCEVIREKPEIQTMEKVVEATGKRARSVAFVAFVAFVASGALYLPFGEHCGGAPVRPFRAQLLSGSGAGVVGAGKGCGGQRFTWNICSDS